MQQQNKMTSSLIAAPELTPMLRLHRSLGCGQCRCNCASSFLGEMFQDSQTRPPKILRSRITWLGCWLDVHPSCSEVTENLREMYSSTMHWLRALSRKSGLILKSCTRMCLASLPSHGATQVVCCKSTAFQLGIARARPFLPSRRLRHPNTIDTTFASGIRMGSSASGLE
jgi:hypothetical protein